MWCKTEGMGARNACNVRGSAATQRMTNVVGADPWFHPVKQVACNDMGKTNKLYSRHSIGVL